MKAVDIDGELHKAEEAMKTSAAALLETGFTQEQIKQLDMFVHASIARIQYGIIKMERQIKSETGS